MTLKKIYRKCKKYKLIQFVERLRKTVKDYIGSILAVHRLKNVRNFKKNKSRNIRVGFIVQIPSVWNKNKVLYEEMQKNKRIEAAIICVPDPHDSDSSSTYRWFRQQGYECMDARVGEGPWNPVESTGGWINLRFMGLDYLMYGEPYNYCLPVPLKSHETSKYTRVCIATYGAVATKAFLEIRPDDFYRDVYCCYAQLEEEREYNIRQFAKTHRAGLQRTEFYGTTVFADIFNGRKEGGRQWAFSNNKVRVLWTPRWACEEVTGGSNFFKYKRILFQFAEENSDKVDFLFRPHPLAFDNFVRTGMMTEQEVEAFKNKCRDMENVSLDLEQGYTAAFWGSDFLITDISTIIVEYFITGKPIIFCESATIGNYLEYFKKVLSCCYMVKDETELTKAIKQLIAGNDPLKTKRESMAREILGVDFMETPKRIVGDIVRDYYGDKV